MAYILLAVSMLVFFKIFLNSTSKCKEFAKAQDLYQFLICIIII